MIKCIGDLNCNLDDFTITNISLFTSKNKQAKPMSDPLAPIINKENPDDVTLEFFKRNYPETLKTPMAIEPQKPAKNMGLTVEIREITKDFSVFGQIYFHDWMLSFTMK